MSGIFFYGSYFTFSMNFANTVGFSMAIWDKTFLSRSIFLSAKVFINWLYLIPSSLVAIPSLVIQSLRIVLFFALLSRKAYTPALITACLAVR